MNNAARLKRSGWAGSAHLRTKRRGEYLMKTISTCLAAGLLVAMAVRPAIAQTTDVPATPPRVMALNGTVLNPAGLPRTGPAVLTFSIYKEQEGGAALWTETYPVDLD